MTKNKGKVLSLFDRSCNILLPWAENGYQCYAVDINPLEKSPHKNIKLIKQDLLKSFTIPGKPKDYVFACAFPICTHTAVSGARWFKSKGPRKVAESFTLLANSLDILEKLPCGWFVENPISTYSTYWRTPDYMFDPYEYGGYDGGENDNYSKKTCLWVNDKFIMPEKKPIDPTDGSRMHKLPPSEERANLRSLTPMGFARAVFEANHK